MQWIKVTGWKRHLLFWCYLLLVCLILRAVFFYQNLHAALQIPQSSEEFYLFNVESGQPFAALGERLQAAGIIDNSFDLRLYARFTGMAEQVKAGEYVLNGEMNALSLLDKLVAGDIYYRRLSIPEGWTLAQALRQIQAHPHIVASIDNTDTEQLQSIFATEFYPEGLFFPDTYNFSSGTSDRELLGRGAALMQSVLAEAWQSRAVGLPYDSPYEALILASIVEKETGRADERRLIAGVFVNRLLNNMRLQTDPTVIYGLGERFTGDLTRANLQEVTPYNTYRNNGLPPTPIALPGREALFAVLNPDLSGYLYFVAKGDGSHYFSSSLEEHNAAVERYQLGIEN